jgi:K+-transporting ATPase ATPase C chain
MKTFLSEFIRAINAVMLLALLLCEIYPLATWGVGQLLFPEKANGSLVKNERRTLGSVLIAQRFDSPAYFHPRPSEVDYAGSRANSGGSNLGPLSRTLALRLKLFIKQYREENNLPPDAPIASDAISMSASGLDPHISPADAVAQARRVAKARGWSTKRVLDLIRRMMEGRQLGIFGEERVNVLRLNLALDNSGKVL